MKEGKKNVILVISNRKVKQELYIKMLTLVDKEGNFYRSRNSVCNICSATSKAKNVTVLGLPTPKFGKWRKNILSCVTQVIFRSPKPQILHHC